MRNKKPTLPKKIPEKSLNLIEDLLQLHPDGLSAREILDALTDPPSNRTLQFHLKFLVDNHRINKEGQRRSTKYLKISAAPGIEKSEVEVHEIGEERVHEISISESGREIQRYLTEPQNVRKPVGYNQQFLESYRPNDTNYLSLEERTHLLKIGTTPTVTGQPAGTYVKMIFNRLLIDLSWNSSRLEGNTYSILDTERLIEEGIEAESKSSHETQMILNHKTAIEFLVDAVDEIGFNRYSVLNLHGILAENLLKDAASEGRLRQFGVGIEGSVYTPVAIPQQIEECFDRMLMSASEIDDPFEQSFFVFAQLPYLQPFDDVNKRVSRLCANIPLFKANLVPICFEDVPREVYIEALLGIYELNRTDLLRDVYMFAYERSVARYATIRQTVGEPDPFRMKFRTELHEVVAEVIRNRLNKSRAAKHIDSWTQQNIHLENQDQFRHAAERILLSVHSGNFARYRITQSEFSKWKEIWDM